MKQKAVAIILLLAFFSLNALGADNIIPYKILKKEEIRSARLSLDVQVDLVDGRLPNKQELAALSNYLVSKEKKHDSSFILFYLPGMKLGEGAFASGHHNPKLKVRIMKYILYTYPQYEKFAE